MFSVTQALWKGPQSPNTANWCCSVITGFQLWNDFPPQPETQDSQDIRTFEIRNPLVPWLILTAEYISNFRQPFTKLLIPLTLFYWQASSANSMYWEVMLCLLYIQCWHKDHTHTQHIKTIAICTLLPQREPAQLCSSKRVIIREKVKQSGLDLPQRLSCNWMRSSINIWDWLSSC